MDTLECIGTRRSIRRYTDEPVAPEHVDTLLAAAMAAPSAGNQQPWRFIVVTDAAMRERMAATSPYAAMLPSAPLAVVICGDTSDLRHPDMWQHDCAAATQNMLLAAHAIGLGAVWLGFYPHIERSEPLAALLGIPHGIYPMAVVAIGHPAEEKEPSNRHAPSFVHHGSW
ncbi:MAG: nitroreductase family protein [Actinomycetota bacterium]|nr:nitroreductase family protein [Actinomycetota bacterium]